MKIVGGEDSQWLGSCEYVSGYIQLRGFETKFVDNELYIRKVKP